MFLYDKQYDRVFNMDHVTLIELDEVPSNLGINNPHAEVIGQIVFRFDDGKNFLFTQFEMSVCEKIFRKLIELQGITDKGVAEIDLSKI